MGFPRHEYWNELPFPSPGELQVYGVSKSWTWLSTHTHTRMQTRLLPLRDSGFVLAN